MYGDFWDTLEHRPVSSHLISSSLPCPQQITQEASVLDGWGVEGVEYEYDEEYDDVAGRDRYTGVAAWTLGAGLGWYVEVEAAKALFNL